MSVVNSVLSSAINLFGFESQNFRDVFDVSCEPLQVLAEPHG